MTSHNTPTMSDAPIRPTGDATRPYCVVWFTVGGRAAVVVSRCRTLLGARRVAMREDRKVGAHRHRVWATAAARWLS